MKQILVLVILMLGCAWLAADAMPDFKLPDSNNKEVKLEDLLGKGPVLVDFWATWCVPCKKAMVALNKLAEKYDSLTVVVVSIDSPKDVAKAKSYIKSSNYKFVSLYDTDKKLATKLNVVNPPHTFIMDKTGEIVYAGDGYEPGSEKKYEEKILALLNPEQEVLPETKTEKIPPEKDLEALPEDGCH